MSGLTRVVVGRASALVSLLMLGLGVLLIVGLGSATHQAQVDDQLPEGYDSTRAAQLSEQLPDEDTSTAVVLFTGDIDRAALGELGTVVKDLSVDRVAVPDEDAAVIPSEDGKAAISILEIDATGATETADAVKALRAQLDDVTPDGIEAQVTGPAAIQADLAAVFDGADFRLLAATASVVAILLVITYRSPILWVIPVARRRHRRPGGVGARNPHTRAALGPVGRVDDGDPVRARLRSRNRLRVAADLAISGRAPHP